MRSILSTLLLQSLNDPLSVGLDQFATYIFAVDDQMRLREPAIFRFWGGSGPEKGVITKGVFSQEKSLESLKSLNSLESPVFCENLQFSAVSCTLQMLEFPGEGVTL